MALDRIKLFISDALRLLAAGAKEDVMTSNFVSYLRQMFPDNPQWVNHYVSGIETSVNLYRRRSVTTGSIDVYIDGTVIEFEKNLTSQHLFTHGLNQVQEYCASKIRSGANISKIRGVLSDTLNWYFYCVQEVPGLDFSAYTTADVHLTLLKDIHISSADDNSAIKLQNCLNEYLGREGARLLTAAFLSEDFGIDSYWGNLYLQEAKTFIESLATQKPAYASLIHDIWSHFVEGIDLSIDVTTGSYEYEFYIATLAKLLCANILEKQPILSNDEEIIEIVSGDYFQRRGYVNFVEYDYFGWINEHLPRSRYLEKLKKIQQDLAIYDYSSMPEEDIFGRLLSQLSVETKRILLGQELTPSWLSDEIVNNVASKLPNGEWPRFIDMCCGSGSMLISTIRYCAGRFSNSTLSDREKFNVVSSAAMGIDIDPLAVLLAKINWIINTEPYCRESTEIVIPVYHADSLFISSPVSTNPSAYVLNLDGNTVNLPRYLLDSRFGEFFPLLIERVSQDLDAALSSSDFTVIVHDCINDCGLTTSPQEESDITEFAFRLFSVLQGLHHRDRNGIWAFLIKNSFKPALIRRKFNGLVSNTPWMALSEVKDNPYKVNLSQKANYYGIKPSGSSFLHLELATVFLIHSIDSYLSDEAVYGCILPRSILNGNQHYKFRLASSFSSSHPFRLANEELWELPRNTFPNRAVALFGRKNTSLSLPFSGRLYETETTYSDASVYTIQVPGFCVWSLTQPQYQILTPYYSFSQGADIMPRCYYYFDMLDSGSKYSIKTLDQNTSSYGFFCRNMKVRFEMSSSIVPKQFFKKTIVSDVLMPFNISGFPLALIPYKRDPNTGEQRVFTSAEFSSLQTPVIRVFNKLKRGYEQYKSNSIDLYGNNVLNYRLKLTNQVFFVGKYLVMYGAGGKKIAASYLKLSDDNVDIILDQTLYYIIVDNEDEALFITGLLNSVVLSEAIKVFQASGLFGERHIHTLPQYFIPRYEPNNAVHTNFVNATKALMGELLSKLTSDREVQQLNDPNYLELSKRRGRLLKIIQSFNSYDEYDRVSRLIIV